MNDAVCTDFIHEVSSIFISFSKKKTISCKVPLPNVERFGMNWRRDRSIHAGRVQTSMSYHEETPMAVKKEAPKKGSKSSPKKAAPKKAAPKKK